jgi:hypothetical protein
VTILHRKLWMWGLAGIAVFSVATGVRSDILFKGKQPQKIGLGKMDGNKIQWTDCAGKNPDSFAAPPYALDPADNCSVGPPAFGLQCDGETCKVVDEAKLRKYLPGVRNGDSAQLRIQEHSVEIHSGSTAIQLER